MSSENQSGGNTNLKKQDLSQLVNICRFNFLIKNTFPFDTIDTLLIGLAEFVLVANLPISKATAIAGFKQLMKNATLNQIGVKNKQFFHRNME